MAYGFRITNRVRKAHGLLEKWYCTRDREVQTRYRRKLRRLTRRERMGLDVLITSDVVARIINEDRVKELKHAKRQTTVTR